MNQFKKAQVVKLPTNEKSDLGLTFLYGETVFDQYSQCSSELQSRFSKFFNLYIISDDKIEDGDWYFDGTDLIHQKSQYNDGLVDGNSDAKKVIATTDTSLKVKQWLDYADDSVNISLPQPPQQFIEKFIEEYNKGDVIKDVLVEYESNLYESFGSGKYWEDAPVTMKKFLDKDDDYLKINPKDNTITIKKLKESWNREEFIQLIKEFRNGLLPTTQVEIEYTNKWIEENL